jgi:hypothetical protein
MTPPCAPYRSESCQNVTATEDLGVANYGFGKPDGGCVSFPSKTLMYAVIIPMLLRGGLIKLVR